MLSKAAESLLLRPYPFQLESANLVWEAGYGMSGDEMGLGKTPEAILLTVAHLMENPKGKILVVVPAFLKATWEREFAKFALHINTLTAHKGSDIPMTWDGFDVCICNYEQLPKIPHLFLKATMVIADEAHYLKNLDAQRTKLFRGYIKKYRPHRLVLLSGTPIKNRVPEWFSILKILGEKRSPASILMEERFRSYNRFCEHFCFQELVNTGRAGLQTKYYGFKNEDDFKSLLEGRYIRHLSKDVLSLPPIVYSDFFPRKIPKAENVMEKELAAIWRMFLRGEATPPVLPALKRESAVSKVPATVELAQSILEANGDDSLVVFTDHVDSANLIAKALSGESITGGTPIAARQKIVDSFQAGHIKVLAATIGTMSAGWTLTRSRRILFNDLPWVPGDFAQAIKRIHRIGQAENCFVHRIITTELDQIIAATLEEKTAVLFRAM